jgi:hypothetical protein
MLLNDVVMGKAIKLRTTDESLMEVRRCIPWNVSWYFIYNIKIATAGI